MKKIGILVKKEMTEILRDKKTLIIMIVMPLLLYPTLLIGLSLGMNMLMQMEGEDTCVVGYAAEQQEYMEPLIALYEKEKVELDAEITFLSAEAAKAAEAKEWVDIWVDFSEENQIIRVNVDYTSTSQNSDYTESVMKELVDTYSDELVAQNLKEEGLTEEFLHPVMYKAVDSVSVTESMGMSIGGTMGMLLITMILLGAFYPAVDITTGEKERGTLETLLTLPVTNFQMIMSKFISVSVFACVTAILSMVALGGSVLFLMLAIPEDMGESAIRLPMDVFLSSVPVLLLALITTALLITAFCMCFCVFAKSSKEANNYMTPIMLVIMMASMVGMMPTIELNYKLSLVPFVNVSLLVKQVFAQQMDVGLALTTAVVNAAYSIMTIWVLARMYNSEDIMFSDDFRNFRLFQKRTDIKPGTIPATGDIVIGIVVLFLAMVYLGGMVSARDMFIGTAVTQLLILALPLFLTWYVKSDKKKLFCWQAPKWKVLPGSILLYIGTYVTTLLVSVAISALFPESMQELGDTFEVLMSQPFILVVLVIALMPAVGEELLFRGLVFGSVRQRYSVWWGIVISAVVFGAFHGFVKIIPTGLLGACFAYVVYKSGSIWVSMALHFVNNFFSVVAMKYPEAIEKVLPILMKESLSIVEVIILAIVAVACLAAGWMLINKASADKQKNA